GVEAGGGRGVFHDPADHDRAFDAGVFGDLADRGLQRAAHDGDAGFLVVLVTLEAVENLRGLQQGDAAAGDDAFFHGRAGRVQGVVDAVLLFLHFHFGRTADADHRNAAGQLGQTFLQLFLVVVGGGVLDLLLDLGDAAFDAALVARPVDDRGVLLGDLDLLGLAEHVDGDVLELDAQVFRDQLAAGQDGDVFQHRLAAIAEARRLDRRHAEAAAP